MIVNLPGLNRSAIADAQAGNSLTGAGAFAVWPGGVDGGNLVDLTPHTFLARLTGARIGAAYGWERVYSETSTVGSITTGIWGGQEARSGTPTNLPAFDPNGQTTLPSGMICVIAPVEQGGTYQYYIVNTRFVNALSIPVAYCDANGELAYYYICLRGDFTYSIGPCQDASSSSSGS